MRLIDKQSIKDRQGSVVLESKPGVEPGEYGLVRINPDYGLQERFDILVYDDECSACDSLSDEERKLRKPGKCLICEELPCPMLDESDDQCECAFPEAYCLSIDPDENDCISFPHEFLIPYDYPLGPRTKDGVESFYMVQLDPRLPRFKLGFSKRVHGRVSTYRCANPEAVLIGSWPCKRNMEEEAFNRIVSMNLGVRIECSEVFDVMELGKLIAFLTEFFQNSQSIVYTTCR